MLREVKNFAELIKLRRYRLPDEEDFEHLFPLFPKGFVTDEGVRNTPGFDLPRYLISFNDHINRFSALGFQTKSNISKYFQANTRLKDKNSNRLNILP